MNKIDKEEILKFVSLDVDAQSVLYDLDLLPEQLKENTMNWAKMLMMGQLIKKTKELRKENENLNGKIKDWEGARDMSLTPPHDEMHCACVPLLKSIIYDKDKVLKQCWEYIGDNICCEPENEDCSCCMERARTLDSIDELVGKEEDEFKGSM